MYEQGLFFFVCTVPGSPSASNAIFLRQRYSPYWLYFPAFAVVMSGLVIYFWHATRTSYLYILAIGTMTDLAWHTAQPKNRENPMSGYLRTYRAGEI